MNPTLKAFLMNVLKNAVNASLTALGPVATWSSQFNFHNWTGIEHILLVMASAAIARELMVYVPKLLAWSQTPNGEGQ